MRLMSIQIRFAAFICVTANATIERDIIKTTEEAAVEILEVKEVTTELTHIEPFL